MKRETWSQPQSKSLKVFGENFKIVNCSNTNCQLFFLTFLCAALKQQGLGYQSQLNKRRQMIESITQEHEKEIEELETQVNSSSPPLNQNLTQGRVGMSHM